MYAVRLINNGIFCKEAVRCETLEQLLARVTVEIVNHAPLALKTAAYNVQKPNSVAFLVTLIFDGRMHLLNIASAFMTESSLME